MFDFQKTVFSLKHILNKRDILLAVILVAIFFISRLISLDQFPIFSDEGIYIRWAKVAWHDASWRFISLTDGKQPLQTWGTIPFLKLFPDNALLAGRLFSVATGFVALTGIFSFLYYLFGKKAAFIGSLFYILTPYFMFYDRMALVDSGVNAVFIWILFFSILLARTQRLDISLLFGLVGGIALLAKSSVRIFIGLAGLAFILFIEKNIQKFIKHLSNFIFLYAIVGILSILIYNIQRLSPFFHYVAEKNKTFVMTFGEWIKNPFAVFFENIKLVPLYVSWEMSFFLAIVGIAGLCFIIIKDKKLGLYFLLWLVIPYIIISFLSKVIFPRYLIFFASLLLIFASYFYTKLKSRKLFSIFIILYLISVLYFDFTILFNHKNIPFPPVDRGQYIEGWPAGWGMKEIVDYAREKSQEKPVIILAEGNFGLSGDVLDTHLKRSDKISVRGYWPLGEKELLENQKELDNNYVYVVFAHKFEYPRDWPVKIIKKFEKPNNQSVTILGELTR